MYATLQDMLDRFGDRELVDLTDRAVPATGVIGLVVLERAIASAAAEIDAALSGRYRVPVDPPVPSLVVDISCDLARWHLYTVHMTDVVAERARSARAQLAALAAGRQLLPLPAALPEAGSPGGDTAEIIAPSPIFGADAMRGF